MHDQIGIGASLLSVPLIAGGLLCTPGTFCGSSAPRSQQQAFPKHSSELDISKATSGLLRVQAQEGRGD